MLLKSEWVKLDRDPYFKFLSITRSMNDCISFPTQHTEKARHRRELNPVPTESGVPPPESFAFLLLLYLKGKSKTWRNKPRSLFLQEKKAHEHLAATLSWHHRGISLGHEAETRRKRQLVSPIPSISQNDTVLYDRVHGIHINKPRRLSGDTQSCWQDSQVKRTAKFTAVTEKRQTGQFKLPHPLPH